MERSRVPRAIAEIVDDLLALVELPYLALSRYGQNTLQ